MDKYTRWLNKNALNILRQEAVRGLKKLGLSQQEALKKYNEWREAYIYG